MRSNHISSALLRAQFVSALLFTTLFAADSRLFEGPWLRHTIDATAKGADGTRLADANGDGLLDITTAWEESGLIRVYLNPGPKNSRLPWPKITVAKVSSPEDAVFA